jgi:hypothetical protein
MSRETALTKTGKIWLILCGGERLNKTSLATNALSCSRRSVSRQLKLSPAPEDLWGDILLEEFGLCHDGEFRIGPTDSSLSSHQYLPTIFGRLEALGELVGGEWFPLVCVFEPSALIAGVYQQSIQHH